MQYGITVKDWTNTLIHALKQNPELENSIIYKFDTIQIENNGCLTIHMYSAGEDGIDYDIYKTLIKSNRRKIGEND